MTPLLENSLRHVLKSSGHDVTVFDDATQTQEDRTISSLFEQMRAELDAVFGNAITTDIENVFLKKPGPHLRHALAHGLLHDGAPYTRASTNLHNEYENYAWKVNKDGDNVGIEDPKCPNHLMSAARYALNMFTGQGSMYDPERQSRERIEVAVVRRRLQSNQSR